MRRRWLSLLVVIGLVAVWFGWREYSHLRSYRASAHLSFVDQFQNGIRGAYSSVFEAQRLAGQGNASAAGDHLAQAGHGLRILVYGANGMSIQVKEHPFDLDVMARYQNEVQSLRQKLAAGDGGGEAAARLADLLHDLTLLQELFGDERHRDGLAQADAAALQRTYESWRAQARIRTDLESR